MENTNRYRNPSSQEDWNENDQGYNRNRDTQNRYQHSPDNENWRDQNYGNQAWQNRGDRSGYNDPYVSRGYANRGSYDDQNRVYFDRQNYRNSEQDYRGSSWNQGYESGSYNPKFDQGNYGSDYRGNRNTRERNWWDRTSDEVASWFGDDDAERRRRMDKINGPHRGKGPKGYTRSDARITEDVNEKLYQDPFVDASNIEVTVLEGEVTLTGKVDSRDTKRRAEDIAEEVPGVKDVTNQLKVDTSNVYDTSNIRDTEQHNGRKKSSWIS